MGVAIGVVAVEAGASDGVVVTGSLDELAEPGVVEPSPTGSGTRVGWVGTRVASVLSAEARGGAVGSALDRAAPTRHHRQAARPGIRCGAGLLTRRTLWGAE
ncbi:MAG: hypothetical protein R2705_24630 [Ilumatobacteraceae bacterium]